MTKPQINTVDMLPNPVDTNAVLKISVDVDEVEIIFKSAYYHARLDAEVISGEEVGIL